MSCITLEIFPISLILDQKAHHHKKNTISRFRKIREITAKVNTERKTN